MKFWTSGNACPTSATKLANAFCALVVRADRRGLRGIDREDRPDVVQLGAVDRHLQVRLERDHSRRVDVPLDGHAQVLVADVARPTSTRCRRTDGTSASRPPRRSAAAPRSHSRQRRAPPSMAIAATNFLTHALFSRRSVGGQRADHAGPRARAGRPISTPGVAYLSKSGASASTSFAGPKRTGSSAGRPVSGLGVVDRPRGLLRRRG